MVSCQTASQRDFTDLNPTVMILPLPIPAVRSSAGMARGFADKETDLVATNADQAECCSRGYVPPGDSVD